MPGGSIMPRGAASCPGVSIMPRGQHHAQEEQHARGSSICMVNSKSGLWITYLHEIEDYFVSFFDFEKQLYI
jgi:hypothetical protein